MTQVQAGFSAAIGRRRCPLREGSEIGPVSAEASTLSTSTLLLLLTATVLTASAPPGSATGGLPPLVQRPPECGPRCRQRARAEHRRRLCERVEAAFQVRSLAFSQRWFGVHGHRAIRTLRRTHPEK